MKAPFPWFGGKSRAASLIWDRFGDVPNYVEPFAGSLAVLLARSSAPGIETVNDLDCYVSNFWRAVSRDAEAVAEWCDWPVNEADLEARHKWLVGQSEFREQIKADPEYYDVRVAGWWVWGLCSWIGTGWCTIRVHKKLPHLGDAGRGIHKQLPQLNGPSRGVHKKLPHLGDAGRGIFDDLQARLRRVRVACGNWDRVLGESVTIKNGVTGVLLDPPYSDGEHSVDYAAGGDVASSAVRQWAIENGANPLLRIALCGYDTEHEMPDGWECVAWKSKGGYGSQSDGRGRENSKRERIWFSPHCLKPDLFSVAWDGTAEGLDTIASKRRAMTQDPS